MNNIEQLKKKYADPAFESDKQQILDWDRDLKKAKMKAKLKDNDAMQIILKDLRDKIKEMEILLKETDSTELPDKERDRVIDRKKLYFWFLNIFETSEATVKSIEESINENL